MLSAGRASQQYAEFDVTSNSVSCDFGDSCARGKEGYTGVLPRVFRLSYQCLLSLPSVTGVFVFRKDGFDPPPALTLQSGTHNEIKLHLSPLEVRKKKIAGL